MKKLESVSERKLWGGASAREKTEWQHLDSAWCYARVSNVPKDGFT